MCSSDLWVGVPTGRSSDRSLTYELELGARLSPSPGTAACRSDAARQRPDDPRGADVRRNLPSPRRCGGHRSDRPTPGDGPRPDQPIGNMDPIDGSRRPHGTRPSRWNDRLGGRHPRGAREPGHLGCCSLRTPSGGSLGRAPDDPAGRRGIGSRGRPSFRAARAGEDATSVAAQTVAFHGHRGVAVMSPRLFLPRAVSVWPLPSRVAVAPGSRTRPPDRPATCGSLAPLVDVRSRTSGGVSRSGGAPSGEAQESIERCGSATNRLRHGFPSGTRPRSRSGVAGERQGGMATR